MTRAKFDIEKFDGTGDFGLCREYSIELGDFVLLADHGCQLYKSNMDVREMDTGGDRLREALTLEDVMATLNLKEIKEMSKAKGDDGEGLYVRGRTDRKDSRYAKKDEQPSSSGSTYDDSKVMMVMSAQAQALLDWIMDSGCSYHMTPRYIPELKRNLISLGTLEKVGFTVKMQSGKVKVINGSRVILFGIRRDNCVYSLDGHAVAGELNASVEEKDSLAHIWHKRLEHISEAGLQVVEKQGLFGKKSLGSDRLCSFRLMGSISGGIIRRFKHEAFGKFKEWKQLVENQTGRTVKKLRTNNGLEFCNREFEQLCIESGIAKHLTFGLPKTFWAEAASTAAYLINRSPSTAIGKNTPMEMWSGHPSDYEMLRIFGYVAYPHDKQGKLEPRAIKCVLLGYPEGVKGYRLYRLDGESPKIVTSRNVVFNESVMYKDTLKDSGVGDKPVEELQVEVELQRLNNHTPEEDQEDGDDEDAGDQ
ncbi:retrotransposon protein, putative, ty1-copia subclass [Tanacetum coccineum]